ncbi:hypothetical protein CAC42_1608 [Sphaceloma murrayae]|uniref:Rhodopsin domain-containing protein n=1 Tax=Sphaceloma murrayae TaxID=2082308 RepID=A0A2K1R382_9PEZI|nr:hypothetical protein CAC42_1608 [Sphaceloma murrayae]
MSDVDKGQAFFIVSIAMYAVTLVVFGVRLIWRWRSKQKGLDDVMLACAVVTLTIHTAFGFIAMSYGFGKSKRILTPYNNKMALKFFFMLQVTYKPLGAFVKMAFLCLYLRIFNIKSFQIVTYAMMANVVLGGIALTVATILQCNPISRAYDKSIPGTCINLMAFWYSHSIWHAVGDFIIFLMPVPVIRTLQIPGSRKLGLISVFALGAFTCAASIVRMTTLSGSSRSNDPSYGSYDATMWTEIESNTSIICACLPALRAPIIQLWRRVRGKTLNGTYGSNSHKMAYVKQPSKVGVESNHQSPYMQRSNRSRNWEYATEGRSWYDTELGAAEQPTRDFFNSSQERMVGIVKTTDVQITRGKDSPEKDKFGSDVEEVEMGSGSGSSDRL